MAGKPAVFLDRDNTLIHNDGDLGDPTQVRLIQGAAMAVASLCGLGFTVVVVTNQGGVARGKYTEDDVDAVHDRLREIVETSANGARIEAFYFCPFHPDGSVAEYKTEHPSRKPAPGMLLEAADDLDLDLENSWMVGDQMRDVQAGAAAGCRTVLLREDAHRLTPLELGRLTGASKLDARGDEPAVTPDFMARNLVEAVRIIASQRHTRDEAIPNSAMVGSRYDAEAMAQLQAPRHEPMQATDQEDQAGTEEAKPPKPFRPFELPPPGAEHDEEPVKPSAKERIAKVIERARQAKQTPVAVEPMESAEVAAEEGAGAGDEPPLRQAATSPVPSEDQTTAEAPVVMADSDLDQAGSEKTLRQILHELRGQRGTVGDASPAVLVAMVLQALAVVCLLGGLWMGAGDDGLFLRWLGAALIAQLATIALLLFVRAGR